MMLYDKKREKNIVRYLIHFLIVFFVCTSCASVPYSLQDAPYLPRDAEYSQIPYEHHILTILAYAPGTKLNNGITSIAGHISVSIDNNGIWGFYPSIDGSPITIVGELKYYDYSDFPEKIEYLDFIIDKDTKQKIEELIAEWAGNPPMFIIPFNDCVVFVYRVCDIAGIRYNSFKVIPINALREIHRLNKPK
ncbi:MAG: hypothetical protein Ta2B_18320 [Termitinemataceae bacterium]|nr:MAG: hypothetical protein Ta2B_18320 [Termitinemataceae bacterium]